MSDKPGGDSPYKTLSIQPWTVKAEHCVWFSYAPDNVPGPHQETMTACRPDFIPLEDENVDAVRIVVTPPEQEWEHGRRPHERSDADGTGVTEDTRDAYKHSDYNSEYIDSENDAKDLCLLVLLFGKQTPPTESEPGKIIRVGLDEREIPVPNFGQPSQPEGLFLGMHDGFQWNNNEDQLEVEIHWLTYVDRKPDV